jgi:lipopolysaccharide transport system ATP-binding protein
MKDMAIYVEGLGKRYNIGKRQRGYRTLRDTLAYSLMAPFRKAGAVLSGNTAGAAALDETIWALKDISFEVKRGEIAGFIGSNGAGKSTLLKILSRVTTPTAGLAEIHGRTGSLLEVGTGFHPELTGRENIYLNGAILGMKRLEITRKFDAIVDFSEVDKFIDTPVKHYSSGMYTRLAFAVAAHLDPEILIIDEVLAVGDAQFQRKCIDKMRNVTKEGKTVLFVSHNLGVISEFCSKCILLSNGKITDSGESMDVVSKYMSANSAWGFVDLKDRIEGRHGEGPMRVTYIATRDDNGKIRSQFFHDEKITFSIGVSGSPGASCSIAISIRDTLGRLILDFPNTDDGGYLDLPSGEAEIEMCLSNNVLNDGTYHVSVCLGEGFNLTHDIIYNCLSFTVDSPDKSHLKSRSPIRLPARWSIKPSLSNLEVVTREPSGT